MSSLDEFVLDIIATQDTEGLGVGEIQVQPIGGTAPYTFWWSNGAGDTSALSGLYAGQYMMQVVDCQRLPCSGNCCY